MESIAGAGGQFGVTWPAHGVGVRAGVEDGRVKPGNTAHAAAKRPRQPAGPEPDGHLLIGEHFAASQTRQILLPS